MYEVIASRPNTKRRTRNSKLETSSTAKPNSACRVSKSIRVPVKLYNGPTPLHKLKRSRKNLDFLSPRPPPPSRPLRVRNLQPETRDRLSETDIFPRQIRIPLLGDQLSSIRPSTSSSHHHHAQESEACSCVANLPSNSSQFPADNSGSLEVGLFLQTMNISGGDGEKGLVGYILKFV